MFRSGYWGVEALKGFPRIRGDVPANFPPRERFRKFSPHTRGCSRVPPGHVILVTSFPRIRGDVPFRVYGKPCTDGFSPHTRGCSRLWGEFTDFLKVFPAYAGMFL